jgi:glutamine amidotransferase
LNPPAQKTQSGIFCATDGQVLAACRHGRALHVAPHIATSGVFAVASEPIGVGPWSEVPEDGFVGIDSDHRVLQRPLQDRGGARHRTQTEG